MQEKPETKPVQTRLPADLIARIDQVAGDNGATRSDRLAHLVMLGLECEALERMAAKQESILDLLATVHDRLVDFENWAKAVNR